MNKCIGILTAGGDSPGINAAIRSVGRALERENIHLLGFRDGFEGIAFDKCEYLNQNTYSGILTKGGTILGTSRNKPHKMPVGKKIIDMTDAIVDTYKRRQLEGLICIGGGGTHKSALRLLEQGLNVITMPKTIDNDLAGTDNSIGYDTAIQIATNAIDSLHSTASSHKRIIILEVMGHRAGWLTLASGVAGGADVIMIPEIPYDLEKVAEAITRRSRQGKRFSIVPVAEGAMPVAMAKRYHELLQKKDQASSRGDRDKVKAELDQLWQEHTGHSMRIARELETLTGLESRVTILGHLQRGGFPSAADRLLATRLGVVCAENIFKGNYGKMMSVQGENIVPVAIDSVAGRVKYVPLDDLLVKAARDTDTCLGD
ncbi:MAG: ATP-dependent 6-phosphofructokinase [Victivallales bacterium]|nr:ATP-dependent 6-phosphofructokinase [Victivallales bacterium]